MKVLVIVARDSAHPKAAGGDRHISILASELAESGQDVTLLSAGDSTLPKQETRGRLTIRRVSSPRLMFPVVWALELTTLHGQFDLVLEESMGGERAPFLARILSGSPCVGFWYEDTRSLVFAMYGRLAARLAGWLQSLLLRLGKRGFAIANSESTARWLITRGFSSSRLAVSTPVIDPAQYPSKLLSFKDRSNTIVSIGNFRATKRFEEAVSILAVVRRVVPNAELTLLGREQDPRYLAGLRQLVSEQGLEDSVRFLVGVDESTKVDLLSRAKVLTIHSPVEGFGWTILEAGLCGVPAVGNTGVSEDALRDGTNGLRLNFADVNSYAAAIVRLLRDDQYWNQLSRGAVSVASVYTGDVLNPEVRDLLSRAVGSKRGGP